MRFLSFILYLVARNGIIRSPHYLLLQSNILQAESSQIRRFPEFWFLPLSICTAWSMPASQNRSTLWNLIWSFVSSGTRIPFLPPSDCWFLRESAFLFLLCFFFSSLRVEWFPKIHSSWNLWRLSSGDLPYADGELMLPVEMWMSRASVPPVESPEVFKRHSLRAKTGADFSAATETLLRHNLSVWNH